jgi:ABC-type phosphate transport system substrate-binding protein
VSLIFVSPSAAQSTDVAVIVNPRNSIADVSSADLRKIFAGEKRYWGDGARVKPIVQAPGCHERIVLLRLLRMSESEYRQYWTAQVFRGEADAEPLTAPSFGMVKEAVTAFRGAIALVDAHNVRSGMDVKIIKVDGHTPGDAGYPIH